MRRPARKARPARHVDRRAARDLLLFLAVFILLCALLFWLAEHAPPHYHWVGDGHAH